MVDKQVTKKVVKLNWVHIISGCVLIGLSSYLNHLTGEGLFFAGVAIGFIMLMKGIL